MTAVALGLAAALAVVCVLVVSRPFLRAGRASDGSLGALSRADAQRLRLLEERDRLLAALQDVEFDRDSQKIADDDYHITRAALRRDVASVLVKLENAGIAPAQPDAGRPSGERASDQDAAGEAPQPPPATPEDDGS